MSIIYGIHAVQALLNKDYQCFYKVFILNNSNNHRLQLLINTLEEQRILINFVNRQCLNNLVRGGIHQGIVAIVKPTKIYHESDLPNFLSSLKKPLLLILDGITDPYNLGACLRSADAAGVHLVIIPKDRSAKLNATVKKVACGAAENVPLIRVTNLVRTMHLLRENNIWIVGTSSSKESNYTLYQSKWSDSLALVMGAEGKGMRRLTREHCDELINIPMFGKVPSLNVSVATGVFLFEAIRNR